MLHLLFKCPQCHTNNHTFPSCPLLKHWYIKKKNRSDTTPDINMTGDVRSAYVQSQSDTIPKPSPEVLDMIEESFDDDFDSNVEFDLLFEDADNHKVNSTSGNVYPYSAFKVSLGSARSVSSSLDSFSPISPVSHQFDVIIDSRCTKQMFPDRSTFISYKPCLHFFVILANKSKTACLGIGTVQLLLGGQSIILHDVLHVPNLRCPLVSVKCFRILKG
jgi:hypothetical protein